MRNLIYLSTAFIFFPLFLSGQIKFQKTIGTSGSDEGYSLLQTNDNRIILTGLTENLGGIGSDILLMELDQEANIIWSKAIGGLQHDFARSIIQTSDNGFALVGSTESFGQGQKDIIVIKTDRNGLVEWSKTLGGNLEERGFSVLQTQDGGYAVCGSTTSVGSGKRDAILYKLDAGGNLEWSRGYGGVDNDNIFNIIQTEDGGYIFTGVQYSYGAGSHDFWVVRLSETGQVIWAKSYGGINEEHSRVILPSPDGNFLVIGHSLTFGPGGWDLLLLKIRPNGDLIWAKTYGQSSDEFSGHISIKRNGNILIYGFRTTSFGSGERASIVIETDPNGQLLRASVFDEMGGSFPPFGPDSPLILINDTDFMLTGTKTMGQFGNEDLFLVKTSLEDIHECASSDITLQEIELNNLAVSNIVPNETTPPSPQDITPLESFVDLEEMLQCVSPIAKIHAPDTLLCASDCITLIDSSLNDPTIFNWDISGGQPASSSQPNVSNVCFNNAGDYEVRLIVANAFGSDTAFQKIVVKPSPVINLEGEETICEGDSIVLSAVTPGATYLWQDGSEESSFTATTAGLYSVTVDLNGCTQEASVSVLTENCTQCKFFIPNAFSPNGDNVNDYFTIHSNCSFESYNMKIFDRWGELLFESDNQDNGWDGVFRNQLMNPGVFTYYISVSFLQRGQMSSKILTGSITLLR